jgi:hypothetical protein
MRLWFRLFVWIVVFGALQHNIDREKQNPSTHIISGTGSNGRKLKEFFNIYRSESRSVAMTNPSLSSTQPKRIALLVRKKQSKNTSINRKGKQNRKVQSIGHETFLDGFHRLQKKPFEDMRINEGSLSGRLCRDTCTMRLRRQLVTSCHHFIPSAHDKIVVKCHCLVGSILNITKTF